MRFLVCETAYSSPSGSNSASPVCKPMRTLSWPSSFHVAECKDRWPSIAAFSAWCAVVKAAWKASPTILKTTPPLVSIAWHKALLWIFRASAISCGCCSHNEVLPSMSVKRKVIVPVGRGLNIYYPSFRLPYFSKYLLHSQRFTL